MARRRRRRTYSKSVRSAAVLTMLLGWPIKLIFDGLTKDAEKAQRRQALEKAAVTRCEKNLNHSLELINQTLYPETFFKRYAMAREQADELLSVSLSDFDKMRAKKIIDDLSLNQDAKTIEFIDRCYANNRLHLIKDDLLSGRYFLPFPVKQRVDFLLSELNKDSNPPESGEYIYCSVSFGNSGKTYHYKTTDETLECGDEVIVPVGNEGRKSVGTIEKIERFKAGSTPFPPSLTKDILGKCEF